MHHAAANVQKQVGGLAVFIAQRAFAPVDIAPLVWFRVVFGGLMCIEIWRFFSNELIVPFYVEPPFLFKFYGFGWVHPLPAAALKLLFLVLAVLSQLMVLGLFYRLAATLFFIGFTYVFLLEEARYLNHFYLICLLSFLLIFVPAHRAFSFDALRRPAWRSGTCPAWALWLLRGQLCIVFIFAGIAKINGDWLHAEPLRMWLAKRAAMPVIGSYIAHEWAAWVFSYGGLLFDLFIVPFLLWRRTRWWAFFAVGLFNLVNGWIFQIGIFPWLTLGATFILFAPKLPHPIRSLWASAVPVCEITPRRKRVILALVGTYLALQISIPLRHWLYPGAVHWTEEGHRFSWRMKLRDKQSELELYAHDPGSDSTWQVDLADYINLEQYIIASGQPDMILQLCHHVAEDFRRNGYPKIQVRAHASVSLNGRTKQLLIDPEVDLAAQPRTLCSANWIKPLTVPFESRRIASRPNPPHENLQDLEAVDR